MNKEHSNQKQSFIDEMRKILKDKGMRNISECVNWIIKGTQIQSLRSKRDSMRQKNLDVYRLYNINRKIKTEDN